MTKEKKCYNITLKKIPADADVPVKEKILEENKMFKKLKNKKGFTLVELIVVLVILAILAALLVPALTGYIDKAREQSLTSEASMVLTAAQATVSEAYGTGALKAAVRDFLSSSPYVAKFRVGEDSEGGDGVSVVDIK